MRIGKSRGSFLPILIYYVERTTGPILELGMGFCSSPYLHWSCYPKKRKLISYESNPEYFDYANSWQDSFHEIHCVKSWDDIDLGAPWTIAFVDHAPDRRRAKEIAKLTHAEYVIIHDTENRNDKKYRLSSLHGLFKYRFKYIDAYPNTSIWSNTHDVEAIYHNSSLKQS